MSHIRGKKSGILSQRHNWEMSNLDFEFLWARCGIVIVSPIFGMGFNIFLGAFSLFKGWENFVVGYCCWLLIFLLLRLTAFLPEQRYKSNLLLMALVILFLSINVGPAPQTYPISNQINSQALRTKSKFKLATNLEDGSSYQFQNQVIILGSQGNYLSIQINFPGLETNYKLEINLEDGLSNQFEIKSLSREVREII